MRSIDDIKYICSDRYTTTNREIAKKICKSVNNENVPLVMAIFKLVNLKEQIIYGSKKQDSFFKKLENNNYNHNFEIITLINSLNYRKKDNEDEIISKYLNSPYIDKIEKNNNNYFIKSSSLGNYKIDSMDSYLEIKPVFLDRIISACCHTNIKYVLAYNPNFYAVTSFIKPIFGRGSCYHSYCLDKDNNKVIDPTYKIVMEKEDYDKLFTTEEIFRVKGNNLYIASDLAINNKIELKLYDNQIASTLFQQYIWENNFPTPNEKIYTNEPTNKHLLIKNR